PHPPPTCWRHRSIRWPEAGHQAACCEGVRAAGPAWMPPPGSGGTPGRAAPVRLLGQDQLVVAGVAQPVDTVAVADQDLAAAPQQLVAAEGFGIERNARAGRGAAGGGRRRGQAKDTHCGLRRVTGRNAATPMIIIRICMSTPVSAW